MKWILYAPRFTNCGGPLTTTQRWNFSSERFFAQRVAAVKSLLIITILCLNIHTVYSQIAVPGLPESFSLQTKNAVVLPVKELNVINIGNYLSEDKKTGIPNRYGVVQLLDINLKSEGLRTEIPGKGYIWQFELQSPQGYSLGITFGKFHLPEGATVFIYNESHSKVFGAFTNINNNTSNQLSIAEFEGLNAVIEYYEPYNPEYPGELAVSSVSQAYRIPLKAAQARIGINCPEGANWQDAKHAVCLMTYHDSKYAYDCTGFLLNNVKQDGTPYFQTANHCLSTSAEAATVVAYFNDENTTCSGNDASRSRSLSGATLKATNSYSDFTLLLLNQVPPVSYLPFYAGWEAGTRNPQSGASIHHPQGTPKCIAIDNGAPVSYSKTLPWTDGNNVVISTSAANTHWQVLFDVGETESGSSGAPLFDDNKRVIGQLHGGSTGVDFYGKFAVSWNYGTTSATQLKYWLDPDNTGTLALDGIYSTIKPKASFSTPLTRICPGSIIKLNDNSLYNPASWLWDIQPTTYEFVNGTTKNSKNPEIRFNGTGLYSVSLSVTNSNGTDNMVKSGYILAGTLQVNLSGVLPDSLVCGCNLVNFPLEASGATSYTFTIQRPGKITSTTKADSLFLTLIPAERKNGSFNSWIKVVGTQGTCSAIDSLELKVSMPLNDDIENSIRLKPGRNPAYTNYCASVQPGEAAPSTTPLKKTIWFTFQSPSSGLLTIDTHGFNDQIAVYDAGSYSQLLTGNFSSYKVMASNTGRSISDNTAQIKNLILEPYRKYWLQVDGTDGATGNCVIDLLSNSIEVYPNPSKGTFNVIITNGEDGIADIRIASLSGKTLLSNLMSVTKEHNNFAFDLSPFPNGLYVIYVTINGSTLKTKLLLQK